MYWIKSSKIEITFKCSRCNANIIEKIKDGMHSRWQPSVQFKGNVEIFITCAKCAHVMKVDMTE